MIELTLSNGEPLVLKAAPVRKFKGNLLPGSVLLKAERADTIISIHQLEERLYSLCHRSLYASKDLRFVTRESIKGYRLETVLTGYLELRGKDGREWRLMPGQYHVTDAPFFQTTLKRGEGTSYFSVYYSSEMLVGAMQAGQMKTIAPRPIPMAMKQLVFEMLENPFDQHLRPLYYENCVREILFLHLSSPAFTLPGELSEMEIAAIHQADRLIAEDLNVHLTIGEIARKAGINAFVLKKGFQQVFGHGVFQRLLMRRMDRAKLLLEKTDKPIKDVSELAGYDTLAGFITAFRKRFGITPREWRRQQRGEAT